MVYGVMWIWHRGAVEVQRSVEAALTPLSSLLEKLHSGEVARVPGTAVFFTRVKDQTPPVMAWHVRQNRALHEYVLALTLTVLSVPWTDPEERLNLERIDDKFWRAEARRGFMERPDIHAILAECKAKGAEIDLDDVTYLRRPRNRHSARERKGHGPLAGSRCSRRWAATRSGSATISNCLATRWSRSAARSRFERPRGCLPTGRPSR